MEKRRIEFLNETRVKMSQIKTFIKRETTNLHNIKNFLTHTEDIEKRKEAILEKLNQKQEELANLEEKESGILNGDYDDEIKKNIILNPRQKESTISKQEIKTNSKPTFSLKNNNIMRVDDKADGDVHIIVPKVVTSTQIKPLNKKERKREKQEEKESKKKEYAKKFDHENYYKKFCDAFDRLPKYIAKNLLTMPNNKGYIFKGCWFFGNKPAEPNEPMVMFEKLYNHVLKIYVISDNGINIFEKKDGEGKKLVETKRRNESIFSES